ncbi:unnamed protein product, partial [Ectocarpus sp. 8 AP-2014]
PPVLLLLSGWTGDPLPRPSLVGIAAAVAFEAPGEESTAGGDVFTSCAASNTRVVVSESSRGGNCVDGGASATIAPAAAAAVVDRPSIRALEAPRICRLPSASGRPAYTI